jgi:hypothetical protein
LIKLKQKQVQEKPYQRKELGEINPKKLTELAQIFDVFPICTIHIKHLPHIMLVFYIQVSLFTSDEYIGYALLTV